MFHDAWIQLGVFPESIRKNSKLRQTFEKTATYWDSDYCGEVKPYHDTFSTAMDYVI